MHARSSDSDKADKKSSLKKMGVRVEVKRQAKLVKDAFWPPPKSKADIWTYLKRVLGLVFSKDGLLISLEGLGILMAVLFFSIMGVLAFVRQDLSSLAIFAPNLPGSVTYYDRTGKVVLWQDYSTVKRVPVSSANISPFMKEATVAIEDKNFYHEGAINTASIIRAAFHDILHPNQGLQGASTITEQVVKLNKGWGDPLSISEKLEEMALAMQLTKDYSKDQILTAYLNIAPYGNIDYGVQAAASDYFHENASQLTLAQAAFLAAIPKSPTIYSPYSSPSYNPAESVNYFDAKDLIARQHYVLDQMVSQGMVSQAQANTAKSVNILSQIKPLQSKYQDIKAPYFVLAAKQQLIQKFGDKLLKHGAWKVITTLDLPLQTMAEGLIQKNIPNVTRYGADEEALVAEQVQTGQVVSLVGGTDFNNTNHGKINYAQINISPGSSIKPYVYGTFINNKSNDAGAGSVIYDNQQPLPGYPCTNKSPPHTPGANCLWDYDFRYPGPETIRYALAGSRNVPAVKAGLMAGINNVQTTADSLMGYPNAYKCYKPGVNVETATSADQAPCYGSSAIGEGAYLHLDETVNGLASFARMGQEVPQTYILQVKSESDKSVYNWSQPKPVQVLNPDSAYIINNILSDPNASYLPGKCSSTTCSPLSAGGYKWQRYNGWDIAVKTGTTTSNISGLMTAWSTQYAVASWVGYHTVNKPLTAGGMEYMTEPLTRGWMEGALSKLNISPVNWSAPADLKTAPAYVIHNHIGLGSVEPSPSNDIYPSWYSPKTNQQSSVVIDKVSGLLATACTPQDARETIANGNAAIFSVDKFVNNQSNIPTTTDNIHNCSDAMPSVTITPPHNNICSNTQNNNQGCIITATISQGTHPISSQSYPGNLSFSINGQVIKQFTINSPGTVSFYLSPTTNGTVTLTATVTDSVLDQGNESITFNETYAKPKPTQVKNTILKRQGVHNPRTTTTTAGR